MGSATPWTALVHSSSFRVRENVATLLVTSPRNDEGAFFTLEWLGEAAPARTLFVESMVDSDPWHCKLAGVRFVRVRRKHHQIPMGLGGWMFGTLDLVLRH